MSTTVQGNMTLGGAKEEHYGVILVLIFFFGEKKMKEKN